MKIQNTLSSIFIKKASTVVNNGVTCDGSSTEQDPGVPERMPTFGSLSEDEIEVNVCAHDVLEGEIKIWKRKGQLPEQNADIKVKSKKKQKKSLKQELLDKKVYSIHVASIISSLQPYFMFLILKYRI